MAEHQLTPGTEILFTRQIHDAHRAGRHYDIRLVVGDKAYSWATRKDIPGVGKSIVLFEQPVHTAHYALSEQVVIPEGSYGAGTTKLDFVRKATIGEHSTQDQMTLHTKSGEKYLLKKLPDGKFGENAWLFRNLGMTGNKYLEKISSERLAVIVKGNPKYLNDKSAKPHAEALYSKLESMLKSKGYTVEFDPGKAYTSPNENASVWIGHSRGIDRLDYAPKHIKTIALETKDASKTYASNDERGLDPAHYQLSDNDLSALEAL